MSRASAGADLVVIDPWWGTGCGVCRESWATDHSIDERLGESPSLVETIYRCRACGTYWQTNGRNGILPISEERARLALAGEPLPVKDGAARLPEFLEIAERTVVVAPDGRLRPPTAPLWDPGSGAAELWQADLLSSVADALQLRRPHLFRWTKVRQQIGSSWGYGMIVDIDELPVRLLDTMDLTADLGADSPDSPVTAFGINTRFLTVRGPLEVWAVGSGPAGRDLVAERASDFAAWRRRGGGPHS